MTKLFIDTNIYLDFYQSANDRLEIFKELSNLGETLIVTEQGSNEFIRNRTSRLTELANNITKSTESNIYTTSLVREIDEHAKIVELQKEIKELSKTISKKILDWRDHLSEEPVLNAYLNLDTSSSNYRTTPELIELAKKRKILGDPPTTPDKHTIGDELIWETLLENCDEDLIICTRDKTFLNNFSLLQLEFEKPSRRLIAITDSPSKAMQLLGAKATKIQDAEEKIRKEKNNEEDARNLKDTCPKCGGSLEEAGYEGSDGDSAWWLDCSKCGATFFPSSGATK